MSKTRIRSPVIRKAEEIEKALTANAAHLLARATDTYSISVETLVPRIRAAIEKYLLRDNPDASPTDVNEFVDKLQADDLCLIVACEPRVRLVQTRKAPKTWPNRFGRNCTGCEFAKMENRQASWLTIPAVVHLPDGCARWSDS
jgi:hypothetical protein